MGYLCCWSLYGSYQRFNQSPVQSMEPLNELKSHHPTTQAQMQKHIVYPDPTTFQLFNQHTLVLLASFPWALYCIHSIKHMKEDKSNKRACFCIGWSLQSIHLSFIGFTELVVSSKQPVTSGTRTAASQATSQSPCGRGFRDGSSEQRVWEGFSVLDHQSVASGPSPTASPRDTRWDTPEPELILYTPCCKSG